MKDDFATALKPVLVHEGGKVNNPKDPGGRTNQGVIQRVYDGFRKNRGRPAQSVYLMTDLERDEIYRLQYWSVIKGDDLPAGVSYVVFDGAVNSGPSQSAKWLQRALGVRVDGVIGEATVDAAVNHPDHDRLVADICAKRLTFLKALRTWRTFGGGWTKRVADVQKRGQAWAAGSVGPAPVYFAGGDAKASIEEAKRLPSRALADVATGTGVATGGLGGTLQAAQEALLPLTGSSSTITSIVAVLVVTGVLVTIGGIVYSRWAKYRAECRAEALDLPRAAAVPA